MSVIFRVTHSRFLSLCGRPGLQMLCTSCSWNAAAQIFPWAWDSNCRPNPCSWFNMNPLPDVWCPHWGFTIVLQPLFNFGLLHVHCIYYRIDLCPSQVWTAQLRPQPCCWAYRMNLWGLRTSDWMNEWMKSLPHLSSIVPSTILDLVLENPVSVDQTGFSGPLLSLTKLAQVRTLTYTCSLLFIWE